jgi:2-succinyl-5-enolpyruvyl-6-hydroxy-3-cyclohexene-1-carboxylate synthase
MSQIAVNNDLWSFHVIDQLIQQEIVNFCIAPGNRNSSLILALSQRKDVNIISHFDERGLAFYAIGLAKALNFPVVIIVTSGTAVANLLPAIMEAHQSMTPLIVITADRPFELQDCMANQAIDQTKLFQNFTKWQCEVTPNSEVSINYLRSIISYSVYKSMNNSKGVIHINFSFREPLSCNPTKYQISIPPVSYLSLNNDFNHTQATNVINNLYSFKKGLIVVGFTSLKSVDKILQISKLLNWPVYIELPSRTNISKLSETLLFQLPYLLEHHKRHFDEIDLVLQFGDRLISKQLSNWIKTTELKNYFIITEHDYKLDETHKLQTRVITSLDPFLELFSKKKPKKINNFTQIKALDSAINKKIHEEIISADSLSEHFLYHHLSYNPPKELPIFWGNSSIIRDANMLFFPHKFKTKHFFNRGVSGIDGNIATAIGIASALNSDLIAILGDLTFLHDLTSLHLIASFKKSVTFFIVNNFGGEIFSQFPLLKSQNSFDKLFKLTHQFNFSKIAEFFNLSYESISSNSELKNYIGNCTFQSSKIIELKINVVKSRNLRRKTSNLPVEFSCYHTAAMATNDLSL